VSGAARDERERREKARQQVEHVRASLVRWCRTNYGEVFTAWIHLKVVRLFVESVLRYGLPVDISAFVVRVAGEGNVDKVFDSVTEEFAKLKMGNDGGVGGAGGDEGDDEDANKDENGDTVYNFVSQKFSVEE